MKTTVTILSILVIISLGYIFFKPYEPTEENQTLINERDQANLKVKRLQVQYDLTKLKLDHKQAELIESKAKVKRSELRLSKALKKYSYAQIENKKVFHYSDFQLDSAFRVLFPVPDSLYR